MSAYVSAAKRRFVKSNITYLMAKSNQRIPAGRIKKESITNISLEAPIQNAKIVEK